MYCYERLTGLITLSLVSACANIPHNDVVIFATSTKVALDVSASASNAGTPTFTLGYKRDEGVWMPLVMNGQTSVLLKNERTCTGEGTARRCYSVSKQALNLFDQCVTASNGKPENCLSAAIGSLKYIGIDGIKQDTYSVFASFGGDFSANGGGKAGINQFFATGIAAQNLSRSAGIAKALVTQDVDAEVAAAATEQANLATQVALRSLGAASGTTAGGLKLAITNAAITCWNKARAAYAVDAVAKFGAADPSLAQLFGGDAEAGLRDAIDASPDRHADIVAITTARCPS